MTYEAKPLPATLAEVGDRLATRLGVQFTNCLLNYYETGDNTMGFHSDDTRGLVPGTGVAIVSLGSLRNITFRSVSQRSIRVNYALQPGSLLYMDATVQQNWQHAIPKQPNAGPRISLTWRAIAVV